MYIIYGMIYSTQDTYANVYYIGVLRLKKKSLHIGVYTNIILYCILKKKIIIIIIINIKIVCTHSTKLYIDYTLHTLL